MRCVCLGLSANKVSYYKARVAPGLLSLQTRSEVHGRSSPPRTCFPWYNNVPFLSPNYDRNNQGGPEDRGYLMRQATEDAYVFLKEVHTKQHKQQHRKQKQKQKNGNRATIISTHVSPFTVSCVRLVHHTPPTPTTPVSLFRL